jgi:hypothetical protein
MRKLAAWTLVLTIGLAAAWAPPASATAAVPSQPSWLRLSLESMQPSVVTASDTSVTMMAKVTNISDRQITDLTSRIQVGDALTSTDDMRSALSPTASYDHSTTGFQPLTGTLAPGQTVEFSVIAPLQGLRSLDIQQPGVYPLMVNVQGVPAYGNTARLVAATMLLPVIAPPGGPAPTPTGTPGHLTVLWPLIDQQPRLVGFAGNEPVLSDDSLATSLAPGGRLFGLLDAVRTTATPALLSSLCFAIDPDLLDTVKAMAGGYRVRTGPHSTVAGQGQQVAALWYSTLRELTQGHCVLVLPYADADLTALAHAGGATLLQLALSESPAIAGELGANQLASVAWPADDAVDHATMADLSAAGVHTVLLDQSSVTPQAGAAPVPLAGFSGGAAPRMVPIDPLVSGAMTPRTDEPNVDEAGVSAQDGLAATIYQTVFGGSTGPFLVAPPRRWAPSEAQATAFLSATATVLAEHYAVPTSLADAVRATPSATAAALNYTPQNTEAEVAHQVAAGAVKVDGNVRDVENSMTKDHTIPTPVLPSQLIVPLRQNLLRAVSSAWRDGDVRGATAALSGASAQFEAVTQEVQVVQPSLPLLLGSKDSRVPVTVNNRLPVDMSVRVDLTGDPGLPSGTKEDVIPAGASVTVFISTSVTRSGRLSAYATVRTIGGTQLGQQARLELVSSAYGPIVVIVTAVAFALLVFLSGLRIYRRVRAARAQPSAAAPKQDEAVGALVGGDRRGGAQQEPDQR